MNNSLNNSARSSGDLLSSLVSGNTNLNRNTSQQIAGINERQDNANVNIANNAERINTQISQQEDIANQQNDARYSDILANSITDLGNIGAGYLQDTNMNNAQNIQNERLLNVLNSMGSYGIDENGNIIFKG